MRINLPENLILYCQVVHISYELENLKIEI